MSEPSGRTSSEPFAWFDPDSSSWKTSQPSLPLENLPEPQPVWPRSGTWDLGHACERPTSAHPTAANASSSLLPTPAAGNFNDGEDPDGWLARREQIKAKGINGNGMGTPLSIAVALLPTPAARLGDKRAMPSPETAADRMGPQGRRNLEDAIALLPTPTVIHHARNKTANRAAPYDSRNHSGMTLLDVFWHGDPTSPPSDAGKASSDDQPLPPPNPTATANHG